MRACMESKRSARTSPADLPISLIPREAISLASVRDLLTSMASSSFTTRFSPIPAIDWSSRLRDLSE